MKECKENFFLLISQIIKLELKYEGVLHDCNHLIYLSDKFGKNNNNKLSIKKYECANIKQQIEDLLKKITELQLDSKMQSYYDLYKERSELFKKFCSYETEIGYITSTLIFDCACVDEIDQKIVKKRSELEIQNKSVSKQLIEVASKMAEIYSG